MRMELDDMLDEIKQAATEEGYVLAVIVLSGKGVEIRAVTPARWDEMRAAYEVTGSRRPIGTRLRRDQETGHWVREASWDVTREAFTEGRT